jgi:hypothetical protein
LDWSRELLAQSQEAKPVEEVDRFIEEYMNSSVPTIRQVVLTITGTNVNRWDLQASPIATSLSLYQLVGKVKVR